MRVLWWRLSPLISLLGFVTKVDISLSIMERMLVGWSRLDWFWFWCGTIRGLVLASCSYLLFYKQCILRCFLLKWFRLIYYKRLLDWPLSHIVYQDFLLLRKQWELSQEESTLFLPRFALWEELLPDCYPY